MTEQYEHVFSHIERPFAWLDLNALDANIDFVNEACGDKQVRIATKSIRSVQLLQYIAEKLRHFAGYMTFTASETLYLLEQGLDQLLIGYPIYEQLPLYDIAHYVTKGKQVTFMVDAFEQLQLLEQVGHQTSTTFQVCIDMNVSTNYKWLYFGTKRSPIHTLQHITALAEKIEQLQHIEVVGCMAYDAQIAGVTDNSAQRLKSALITKLKQDALPKVTKHRQQLVSHLKHYFDLQFVNAGGTGSMGFMKEARDVTEITVGSAFYAPALFSQYKGLALQPAAGFGLRITRKFTDDTVVCHGGGYIASGAIGQDKQPQFLQPEHYAFSNLEGAGEVQTPIVLKDVQHQIGDTIYFRHAKAGELCERFLALHATRDGRYVGAISTYRGDGQCFL